MPSMITVHHLENSRSQRVLWLLEELALPYEVRRYQRAAQDDAAFDDYLRTEVLARVPQAA